MPGVVREWSDVDAHVGEAMAEFVLRLSEWERCGTGEAWTQVQEGYGQVLEAWTGTVSRYFGARAEA